MLRKYLIAVGLLALASPVCLVAQPSDSEAEPEPVALGGCSFRSPGFDASSQLRDELLARVRRIPGKRLQVSAISDPPRRRSFIDDEIFGRLETEGVQPARLSEDAEFVRRIHLDLTGRLPSAATVSAFLADASADKRDVLIDRLLHDPAFTDKWSVWFGDLLQNATRLSTSQRQPQIEGRNGLDRFIRDRLANNRPVREIVTELLTGTGNNYFTENGPASYMVLASTAMGPAQDTYDMAMVRATTAFLGMAHYDCLSCHDGFRHLDTISSWGGRTKRTEAWKMAAFFSRTRWVNGAPGMQQGTHPL
jgi:hypothetical protein